jgi:hypothetical protein
MEATAQILQLLCQAKARSDPLIGEAVICKPADCVAQDASGRSAIAYAERSLYFSSINNMKVDVSVITVTRWGVG